MRGSLVKFRPEVITGMKKESLLTSIPLSARPVVLLKERMRAFNAMMNCVGPTVPMVSGGQLKQSGKVAAVKFRFELTVCAVNGEIGRLCATASEARVSAALAPNGATKRGATCRWRNREGS